MLLLLVLAAVIGVLMFAGLRMVDGGPAPIPEPPRADPGLDHVHAPPQAGEGPERVGAFLDLQPPGVAEARPPTFPAELFTGERFEGTGRLQVIVETPAGVPFPSAYRLVLEPSTTLIGGEYARRQVHELDGAQRQVDLTDVPLGGYELRAFADGMASAPELLLLALPHENHLLRRVELRPLGFLTGRVVDADGADVEGLTVVVENKANGTRVVARTDPAGVYLFEKLPDGEYRLFLGSPENAFGAPRELSFRAPSLSMPQLEVPLLHELSIRVLTKAGGPVAGAVLDGYGKEGGRISATTDAQGFAAARFLPAGRVTVFAHHETLGEGKGSVTLEGGGLREIEIRLSLP